MPLLLQHFLVLAAVLGCIGYIARGVYRSLHGRKSKLNGCGACGGCAAPPAQPKPAGTAFIPAEMLVKRR